MQKKWWWKWFGKKAEPKSDQEESVLVRLMLKIMKENYQQLTGISPSVEFHWLTDDQLEQRLTLVEEGFRIQTFSEGVSSPWEGIVPCSSLNALSERHTLFRKKNPIHTDVDLLKSLLVYLPRLFYFHTVEKNYYVSPFVLLPVYYQQKDLSSLLWATSGRKLLCVRLQKTPFYFLLNADGIDLLEGWKKDPLWVKALKREVLSRPELGNIQESDRQETAISLSRPEDFFLQKMVVPPEFVWKKKVYRYRMEEIIVLDPEKEYFAEKEPYWIDLEIQEKAEKSEPFLLTFGYSFPLNNSSEEALSEKQIITTLV